MRTALRGIPAGCRWWLATHSPRLPANQKARCRYMAAKARSVPLSMPTSEATRSTAGYGIMSKHLT